MILSAARNVILNTLHATSGAFAADEIDNAILLAGNEYVRRTKCTRAYADVTLASGSNTVNIVTTIPLFRSFRWIGGTISHYSVKKVAYETMARDLAEGTAGSGRPERISFPADNEAYLTPVPSEQLTLRVRYYKAFGIEASNGSALSWTPGGTDGTTTGGILNIPEEVVHGVLRFGAVPALVSSAPGVLLRTGEWDRFEQFIEETMGLFIPDDGVWFADPNDYTA
jgi:hypothetical protein